MQTPIKQKPRPDAANIESRAKNQIQRRHSTLIREIIGMAIAAAIFTASVWTSVFGMSGMDKPEAITVMAEVSNGHR